VLSKYDRPGVEDADNAPSSLLLDFAGREGMVVRLFASAELSFGESGGDVARADCLAGGWLWGMRG
jgi:hypothetical protein